ncbi:MAG: hypothetical protein C0421_01230 [Hyphomonas sp.]|uniref:fasciclin domain-containing protein n=1 Tax=Hyphomonas sp. TaxID=87 RepID=UPI0025BBB70A|nr:fasciclin domain-containing protein [Hyphomonas sp.]MBA4337450.1 hypothetical protein [Hyphomonas sp.]
MRHLFASCAVIALMAAPALAQSTYEPTEPLVESEQALDPTMREEANEATDFEREAEPVTDAEPVDEADAETSDDTAAETAPSTDRSMTTETPVTDDGETALEADVTDEDTAVADSEPMFGTETLADTETFEAPINVAELPEEYSTADLNAMMLAQLHVVAVEIAEAQEDSGTNVYASSEPVTEPDMETAMTDAAPADEASTEDYAAVEPIDPALEAESSYMAMQETAPADDAATEDYASNVTADPSMGTESVEPAGETATMADETDDSVQMAEQPDGTMVTAEGDIDQTAVEIAAQDDRFTTLVELVGLAGLEDDLSLDGPYTVFAPTNDAFAALPEETLTRLKSEEGKAELVEILQSHVAEGRLIAGEVPMAGKSIETIGEASLNVTGSVDGTLNIEGSNTVGDGVYASNGVVYAVDAVILPEATPEPAVTPEN